jgi:UDP:flavonoid glycosyltransferase YjiC (YdhE family)
VQVERFVASEQMMRLAQVIVHHGGSGTLLGALAHGIPQLVLPYTPDQSENGEALATAGAGCVMNVPELSPDAVAQAACRLLRHGPERVAAGRLCDELRLMPAPPEVVPLLEKLAARGLVP